MFCEEAQNSILYSFVNQNLSINSIYKCEDRQDPNSSIYFYKNYRSDWNEAIIDIINDEEPPDKNAGRSPESGIQSKENKISKICEYLIGEAERNDGGCSF